MVEDLDAIISIWDELNYLNFRNHGGNVIWAIWAELITNFFLTMVEN